MVRVSPDGVYKIGCTRKLWERANRLLCQHGYLDYVHHITSGDSPRQVERYLHGLFWPWHVRDELFRLSDDQVRSIRAVSSLTFRPGVRLRVLELRQKAGLTAEHLGRLAGVSKLTVYNCDTGRGAAGRILHQLAQALGVSVNGLFTDTAKSS